MHDDGDPTAMGSSLPPDTGDLPTPENPDPAPERGPEWPADVPGEDRGAAGAHPARDNIREGKVSGILAPPGSTHGEGQGG